MLQNVLQALPMSHPFWTMISRSAKNQCLEEFYHWKLVCREVLSSWNEMQAAPIAHCCTLLQNIPLSLLLQTIANYSTIAPLIHTIEMRCTLCNANRICFITPNILNFWPTFRIAFRTTIKCILDCFTNIKILEIAIAQCWFLVLGPMETDVRKYVLLKNNSFPYQLLRNFASLSKHLQTKCQLQIDSVYFVSFR